MDSNDSYDTGRHRTRQKARRSDKGQGKTQTIYTQGNGTQVETIRGGADNHTDIGTSGKEVNLLK